MTNSNLKNRYESEQNDEHSCSSCSIFSDSESDTEIEYVEHNETLFADVDFSDMNFSQIVKYLKVVDDDVISDMIDEIEDDVYGNIYVNVDNVFVAKPKDKIKQIENFIINQIEDNCHSMIEFNWDHIWKIIKTDDEYKALYEKEERKFKQKKEKEAQYLYDQQEFNIYRKRTIEGPIVDYVIKKAQKVIVEQCKNNYAIYKLLTILWYMSEISIKKGGGNNIYEESYMRLQDIIISMIEDIDNEYTRLVKIIKSKITKKKQ